MVSDGLDWIGLESIWIWTGNVSEKLHMGGGGFKISTSGLNMSRSTWKRLKMSMNGLKMSGSK